MVIGRGMRRGRLRLKKQNLSHRGLDFMNTAQGASLLGRGDVFGVG